MFSSSRRGAGRQDTVITSEWAKSLRFNVRLNVSNLLQQTRVGSKKILRLTHEDGEKCFIYITISMSLTSKHDAGKLLSQINQRLSFDFRLENLFSFFCLEWKMPENTSNNPFRKTLFLPRSVCFYCTVWLQVEIDFPSNTSHTKTWHLRRKSSLDENVKRFLRRCWVLKEFSSKSV